MTDWIINSIYAICAPITFWIMARKAAWHDARVMSRSIPSGADWAWAFFIGTITGIFCFVVLPTL